MQQQRYTSVIIGPFCRYVILLERLLSLSLSLILCAAFVQNGYNTIILFHFKLVQKYIHGDILKAFLPRSAIME